MKMYYTIGISGLFLLFSLFAVVTIQSSPLHTISDFAVFDVNLGNAVSLTTIDFDNRPGSTLGTPTTDDMHGIYFVDPVNRWVVGKDGSIILDSNVTAPRLDNNSPLLALDTGTLLFNFDYLIDVSKAGVSKINIVSTTAIADLVGNNFIGVAHAESTPVVDMIPPTITLIGTSPISIP